MIHFLTHPLSECYDQWSYYYNSDQLLNRFIRARHYLYHYTTPGSKEAINGQWWRRELIGDYLPIVTLHSLYPILKEQGWLME